MAADPYSAIGDAATGRMRAALNFGNRVLVGRDDAGAPVGISVDIARALAAETGADLEFVEFERAVDVADSAERDLWDVCFLAVDPARGQTIAFTAPYVRISGCYLVSAAVEVATSADVVDQALRIGVVDGSAYTLHLSRQPGAEHLVTLPDIGAALEALDRGEIDGIAGIEQAMAQEAALRPGARVLQPPFMEIRQAMGMPASRGAAAIEELRRRLGSFARDGLIRDILERHGVAGDCALLPD